MRQESHGRTLFRAAPDPDFEQILADFRQDVPGQVDRLWILDVDGRRIVMVATTTPHENATETADLLTIAHSVHFIDHPPTNN